MDKIERTAGELLGFTDARSIFLYGSRARADFHAGSDYEIGVLMEKGKYVGRSEIRSRFDEKGIRIFPFHYEDFIAGNPDTPFQKSIHMREIIEAGRTLAGEEVIEKLDPPEIRLLDVIQGIRFNLGYALAATHSHENGDSIAASLHLAKSCLFGTRDYLIFKSRKFIVSYDDILQASKGLDLQEYQDLPAYAFRLRKRSADIDGKKLFQNISYLNKFIEAELLVAFGEEGNEILIE